MFDLLWVKGRDMKAAEGALRKLKDRAVAAVRKFLFAEALEILARAKQLCPVDTGALRASGYVETPRRAGQRIAVLMGFGGPAAPYAYKVHEDLVARHAVGEAKFLEKAAVERLAGLHDRMVAFLEAELGRAA